MKREKNHWAGCPGGISCRACKRTGSVKQEKQGNSRAIRRKERSELRKESA